MPEESVICISKNIVLKFTLQLVTNGFLLPTKCLEQSVLNKRTKCITYFLVLPYLILNPFYLFQTYIYFYCSRYILSFLLFSTHGCQLLYCKKETVYIKTQLYKHSHLHPWLGCPLVRRICRRPSSTLCCTETGRSNRRHSPRSGYSCSLRGTGT